MLVNIGKGRPTWDLLTLDQESPGSIPAGATKSESTGSVGSLLHLANAIESIQVGIEDWQTGTHPRLLSAVRNIHAGILLLFKEALLRQSPEHFTTL